MTSLAMVSAVKRVGEAVDDAAHRKKPRFPRPDGFERKPVKPTSVRKIPAPQFQSAFASAGEKPRSSGVERISAKPRSSGGEKANEKPRSATSIGRSPPKPRVDAVKAKDGLSGAHKRLVAPPRPEAAPGASSEKPQKPTSSSKKTVPLKQSVWAGDASGPSKKPLSAPRPPAFPQPAPGVPVSAPRPPAFPLLAPGPVAAMKPVAKPPQYIPTTTAERPTTPPLLRPITRQIAFEPPRASTAKQVPMKVISAFAADVGSEGGKAEVFGMFLRQNGVRYLSEGERELGRGLEISPEKMKGGGGSGNGSGARYLRGGFAERAQKVLARREMSLSLWNKELGGKAPPGPPALALKVERVVGSGHALRSVILACRPAGKDAEETEEVLVLLLGSEKTGPVREGQVVKIWEPCSSIELPSQHPGVREAHFGERYMFANS